MTKTKIPSLFLAATLGMLASCQKNNETNQIIGQRAEQRGVFGDFQRNYYVLGDSNYHDLERALVTFSNIRFINGTIVTGNQRGIYYQNDSVFAANKNITFTNGSATDTINLSNLPYGKLVFSSQYFTTAAPLLTTQRFYFEVYKVSEFHNFAELFDKTAVGSFAKNTLSIAGDNLAKVEATLTDVSLAAGTYNVSYQIEFGGAKVTYDRIPVTLSLVAGKMQGKLNMNLSEAYGDVTVRLYFRNARNFVWVKPFSTRITL